MSLIMDHPAWLPPSQLSGQSNFRVCPCSPSRLTFSPSSPTLSLPLLQALLLSTSHMFELFPLPVFLLLPYFSAFCKLRCLLLDVLSLLPQRRLHSVCLSPHFSLVVLPQLLSPKAVSSLGSNHLSPFLSPKPCHLCPSTERCSRKAQTEPLPVPCQIRLGTGDREKTHPNNSNNIR